MWSLQIFHPDRKVSSHPYEDDPRLYNTVSPLWGVVPVKHEPQVQRSELQIHFCNLPAVWLQPRHSGILNPSGLYREKGDLCGLFRSIKSSPSGQCSIYKDFDGTGDWLYAHLKYLLSLISDKFLRHLFQRNPIFAVFWISKIGPRQLPGFQRYWTQ